jgi:hypothetical protein
LKVHRNGLTIPAKRPGGRQFIKRVPMHRPDWARLALARLLWLVTAITLGPGAGGCAQLDPQPEEADLLNEALAGEDWKHLGTLLARFGDAVAHLVIVACNMEEFDAASCRLLTPTVRLLHHASGFLHGAYMPSSVRPFLSGLPIGIQMLDGVYRADYHCFGECWWILQGTLKCDRRHKTSATCKAGTGSRNSQGVTYSLTRCMSLLDVHVPSCQIGELSKQLLSHRACAMVPDVAYPCPWCGSTAVLASLDRKSLEVVCAPPTIVIQVTAPERKTPSPPDQLPSEHFTFGSAPYRLVGALFLHNGTAAVCRWDVAGAQYVVTKQSRSSGPDCVLEVLPTLDHVVSSCALHLGQRPVPTLLVYEIAQENRLRGTSSLPVMFSHAPELHGLCGSRDLTLALRPEVNTHLVHWNRTWTASESAAIRKVCGCLRLTTCRYFYHYQLDKQQASLSYYSNPCRRLADI